MDAGAALHLSRFLVCRMKVGDLPSSQNRPWRAYPRTQGMKELVQGAAPAGGVGVSPTFLSSFRCGAAR